MMPTGLLDTFTREEVLDASDLYSGAAIGIMRCLRSESAIDFRR